MSSRVDKQKKKKTLETVESSWENSVERKLVTKPRNEEHFDEKKTAYQSSFTRIKINHKVVEYLQIHTCYNISCVTALIHIV